MCASLSGRGDGAGARLARLFAPIKLMIFPGAVSFLLSSRGSRGRFLGVKFDCNGKRKRKI